MKNIYPPVGEAIAELILAAEEPNSRMAILVNSKLDFRDEMLPVITHVVNSKHMGAGNDVYFEPARGQLRWSNGSTAKIFSVDTPEQLKGHRIKLAWFIGWPRPGVMEQVLHCRYSDQLMRLVFT